MKFIKRLVLDRKNQTSNRLVVDKDNKILTNTKVSLQLPSGATGDRPVSPVNGQVRYSTTLNDSEIYNIAGTGTGWEKIRTNRQQTITPQNLGVGNYINTVFGPLSYDVSTSKPQNVLVFVDNVFQIPTTNYTLIPGTSFQTTASTTDLVSIGTTTVLISTTTNVVVGQLITAPSGLQAGTTVTSVSNVTQSVEISLPATGNIGTGTIVTFSYQSGVFVEFTGPVPAKQVFVLLGFDGYSP